MSLIRRVAGRSRMPVIRVIWWLIGPVAVLPWGLQALGLALGVPPQVAEFAAVFGAGWLSAIALVETAAVYLDEFPNDRGLQFLPAIVVFIVFSAAVLAGVRAGEFKLANATITILLSGITLLLLSTALHVISAAVRMFIDGHRIEVQSQWGGLGGGLGGWQISQLAGMVLLAAMLIGGSLGALVALRGDAVIATEPKPKGGTAPAPDAKPGGDTSPAGKTNSKSG